MPINQYHAFAKGNTISAKQSILEAILNRLFQKLYSLFENLILYRVKFIFLKNSDIHPSCQLGLGAWCVNNHLKTKIRIGQNSIIRGIIRREFFNDGEILIGNDVYLGDDTIISCSSKIIIGDGTMVAHGVQIFDNNTHPIDFQARKLDWSHITGNAKIEKPIIKSKAINIGKNCWIGMNCIILKGVTIGDGAIISAGSIIREDVPASSLVAVANQLITTRLQENT